VENSVAITDTVPAAGSRVNLAAWAPPVFVLLWSTGFIGAKFGLPYAEPFTLLLLRFGLASLLLIGLALALRAPWPRTPMAVFHIVVAGLLLHALYIGGVFVAISLGMPAGVTSLVVGLQPVLTAIFAPALLKERIIARQWLGLLRGLAGVGLVVGENLVATSSPVHPITFPGMLAAVLALLGTTFGTLYQRRFCSDMSLTSGSAIQYLATSVVMLVAALSFETMRVQPSAQLIGTVAWLVLALSLGAILLLFWLIRQNAASRVASLFYLVPPLTAIEAFVLFNERLGLLALVGMALAMLGVALVLARKKES
jgi:drug/metabolite transporter (DMT)-like permease